MPYEYAATCVRTLDGDTVEVDLQLGFHITYRVIGRLDGIDAPELRTPEGKVARAALEQMVQGKTLLVRTILDHRDKYGRPLLVILLENGVTTANQAMVDSGHARPYFGGPRT